jgi:hypothetical protein
MSSESGSVDTGARGVVPLREIKLQACNYERRHGRNALVFTT